jgi:prolipoprotein diacylglyceryltransferase/protein-S-isoprenylcysteine O-methyltransferase Ste14
MAMHPLLGKALYGSLFVGVLPLALVLWAAASAPNVMLPPVRSVPLGAAAAGCGASLVAWGMASLTVHGGGLPMNAYPPPRFVARGIYRLVGHPIYLGFCLLCIGCSIARGSAGGLWLVSPVVVLASVALVLGHERIDLRRRFGEHLPRPLLSIPLDEDVPPSPSDRAGVYVLVLGPWLLLYEWLAALGVPSDAVVAYLPFERGWPVLAWTESLYASTYAWVALAPLVAGSRRVLREFAIRGGIATLLMPLLFVTLPLVSPPRPFGGGGAFGELLLLERSLDTPANAFPSYHVVWIVLAMTVYARRMPGARAAWWLVGGAVSVSAITTGMHAIVDVVAGWGVAGAVVRYRAIWESLRRWSERICNSWREWQWGPVRVINHGVYAGIGSFLALLVVGSLVGEHALGSILLVALSSLVVSALWAQIVEGSPSLLRPYGFYGGVLGGLAGCVLARLLFGTDAWLLIAAFAVSGPWVQSFGRVRCLVQGCCHGRKAPASIGIVYRHPRSRVCRLSDLGGVPVHPTPLYSILCNAAIAPLLARLWLGAAPLSLIGGAYLILTGLGRFVEEAYRGEPQTRVLRGLRLYQWIAIASAVGGAAMTCVPSAPAPAGLHLSGPIVLSSLGFGLATWFALGVDFPRSNRRFARLV